MFIYASWGTTLVNNYSLKYLNIDREIEKINFPDLSPSDTGLDMSLMDSPRERKNGRVFYWSNGYVSLVSDSYWKGELDFLIGKRMQWGRDMVRVEWYELFQYFTPSNNEDKEIECDWINCESIAKDNSWAKFSVMPEKMFKGFSTKVIRG